MALWNCCHITKITNLPEQILISYELGFPISKIKFSSIFMQTIPICETAFISETQTYFPFISIYNMFLQQYFRQLIGFSAYICIFFYHFQRPTFMKPIFLRSLLNVEKACQFAIVQFATSHWKTCHCQISPWEFLLVIKLILNLVLTN